ncbi:MAG: hypothetical protein KJ072_21155 [Verrucomicrobia bacterium]|nr:hypothetical protein [Verrucomicrobiota bacterium]
MKPATKRIGVRMAAVLAGSLGALSSAQACATCFGASDSAMAQGMNMGIMSLLGVIGTVLLGVVGFFGYLAWRANRWEESENDDRLSAAGDSVA